MSLQQMYSDPGIFIWTVVFIIGSFGAGVVAASHLILTYIVITPNNIQDALLLLVVIIIGWYSFLHLASKIELFNKLLKVFESAVANVSRSDLEILLRAVFAPRDFKPNQVTVEENVAKIQYSHLGVTKNLYLPYDTSMAEYMRQFYVYLSISNEDGTQELKLLDHYPGIPYYISAGDLNGNSIIIKNLSGENVWEFNKDEICNFIDVCQYICSLKDLSASDYDSEEVSFEDSSESYGSVSSEGTSSDEDT